MFEILTFLQTTVVGAKIQALLFWESREWV